ncbi:MAG: NYN domain-containing protein, partial [Planctomycetota bacterium]
EMGGGPEERPGKDPAAPLALARLVSRSGYARRDDRQWATLVCDGVRPPGREPESPPVGVRIVYSGPTAEADDLIERLIAENNAPRRLLVVSADRRILAAARRRQAGNMASEVFLSRVIREVSAKESDLGKPQFTRDLPLRKAALVFWLEEFGYHERIAEAEDLVRPEDIQIGSSPAPGHDEHEDQEAQHLRRRGVVKLDRDESSGSQPEDDEELRRALRDAGSGSIDPDELDMKNWL